MRTNIDNKLAAPKPAIMPQLNVSRDWRSVAVPAHSTKKGYA